MLMLAIHMFVSNAHLAMTAQVEHLLFALLVVTRLMVKLAYNVLKAVSVPQQFKIL